jgi:hypothetical protein
MRGILERGRVRSEHDVRQQRDFTVPPCRAVDPSHPVVCFDESPTQLIGEVRETVPAAPGQPERYDYEYRRNGTANCSCFSTCTNPGAM